MNMHVTLTAKELNAVYSLIERFAAYAYGDDVNHVDNVRKRLRSIIISSLGDGDRLAQFDNWVKQEKSKLDVKPPLDTIPGRTDDGVEEEFIQTSYPHAFDKKKSNTR